MRGNVRVAASGERHGTPPLAVGCLPLAPDGVSK